VLAVVAFVHRAVEKVEGDVVTGEVSNVVFKLAVVAVVAVVVVNGVVVNGVVDNGVVVVVAFVSGKNLVDDVRFTAIVVEELVKVLAFAEEVEAD
jgi:hypothetical protein